MGIGLLGKQIVRICQRLLFYCISLCSLGALCLLLIILTVNKCDDAYLSHTSSYKSYQEALAAGAVQSGWIPAFVPEDAYAIEEWHYLSPNEQVLCFKFSDPKLFKHKIHAYKQQDEKLGELRPKSVSRDQIERFPKKSTFAPTEFYHMPDFHQGACLLIDWSTQQAYFYSHCMAPRDVSGP